MKRYLYFSQNCQILEIPHFMHERIQKFFPGGSESKVGGGMGYTNHQKSNKKKPLFPKLYIYIVSHLFHFDNVVKYVYYARVY